MLEKNARILEKNACDCKGICSGFHQVLPDFKQLEADDIFHPLWQVYVHQGVTIWNLVSS